MTVPIVDIRRGEGYESDSMAFDYKHSEIFAPGIKERTFTSPLSLREVCSSYTTTMRFWERSTTTHELARIVTHIGSPLPRHKELGETYIAVLEEDEEGGFVATIPALRGCISEGDNPEEALDHLRDALDGWLEVAQRRGLDIPPPDGVQIS